MGLLITTCLIKINAYNAIDAPTNRQFSNVELWFGGNLIIVIVAILEYGLILFLKKFTPADGKLLNFDKMSKTMDLVTFFLCCVFMICFNFYYWL